MKHFRFGRLPLAVPFVALLLGGLAPAPAVAAPPQNVIGTCTGTLVVDIDPGLSLVKQDIRVTTVDDSGTITCVLTVNGVPVTGVGTFDVSAKLFGNCLAADGTGDLTIDLGTVTIKRTFAFFSDGLAAVVHGEDFRSTPSAVPTEGELCVTPITRALGVFPIVFIDK